MRNNEKQERKRVSCRMEERERKKNNGLELEEIKTKKSKQNMKRETKKSTERGCV